MIQMPVIQPYKDHKERWRYITFQDIPWSLSPFYSSEFIVPAGFDSDLASIPRLFEFFFNPYDPMTVLAALIHDWLTPTEEERSDLDNPFRHRPLVEPRTSAGVFYEVMSSTGVPVFKRKLYYAGVVFGIKES